MLRLVEAVVGQLGALLGRNDSTVLGHTAGGHIKRQIKRLRLRPLSPPPGWGSLGLVQSIYSKGITTMMMPSLGRCSWLDFSFVVGDGPAMLFFL